MRKLTNGAVILAILTTLLFSLSTVNHSAYLS